MFFTRKPLDLPTPESALPGRTSPIVVPGTHFVLGTSIAPPFPEGLERIVVGMGCFWGAERMFWQAPGVYTSAAGYAGGLTPNPTYEEVLRSYGPHRGGARRLRSHEDELRRDALHLPGAGHDPTQGMRQGNDVGTQYRSAIYFENDAQQEAALASNARFQAELAKSGYGEITTEIAEAGPFYYAEDYHQQYLAKNPNGYCGLGGTGVSRPVGTGVATN